VTRRRRRPFKANRPGHSFGFTDEETSVRMAGIRQKGTAPELVVRKIAYSLGLRYRLDNRDLPGSPDLANRSKRWAIFVHGCFWHRHPGCSKTTTPSRNREFWEQKFERNVERDDDSRATLAESGWRVAVVWECECADVGTVSRTLRAVTRAGNATRRAARRARSSSRSGKVRPAGARGARRRS
jgi:DNA mismatch endonuclease, patch repair protein